jgi:hypothetical protein
VHFPLVESPAVSYTIQERVNSLTKSNQIIVCNCSTFIQESSLPGPASFCHYFIGIMRIGQVIDIVSEMMKSDLNNKTFHSRHALAMSSSDLSVTSTNFITRVRL